MGFFGFQVSYLFFLTGYYFVLVTYGLQQRVKLFVFDRRRELCSHPLYKIAKYIHIVHKGSVLRLIRHGGGIALIVLVCHTEKVRYVLQPVPIESKHLVGREIYPRRQSVKLV